MDAHKARRLREKEAMHTAILEATRKLAIKEGWVKVSIRNIAKIIEYTPPVIYDHFKSKEAILIELEIQGFRKLKYALEEARERSSEPRQQLVDMSDTYWEWAFTNAELYQVMFNLDGVKSSSPNPLALKETAACVTETLKQIRLFSSDTEELFFNWWALVHGHVSLVMSGQIVGMNSKIRRHLRTAIERFAEHL